MAEMITADDGLLLAEILATRLCHDLSGQVNTLVAAVEMLRDEPAAADEAMGLASDAGQALVRRLRLLRAAWGANCLAMRVADLRSLVHGAFGAAVHLDLDGLDPDGAFSPDAARLVLNVMLLAVESLPGGGAIALAGDPTDDVMIRISGPRAGWPPGLAGMLADPAHARVSLRNGQGGPRTLQAPLTAMIAHTTGLRLAVLMAAQTEAVPPLLMEIRSLH
jgi:histidine phosphotransferase ChpT